MQYTVSMTTRMLVIAGLCVFLLCVLLFLLGIELGKRLAPLSETTAVIAVPPLPAVAVPALPSAPLPRAARSYRKTLTGPPSDAYALSN